VEPLGRKIAARSDGRLLDSLLPDRSQLLLGSVLQVLDDGLVVLHAVLVESGDVIVMSSASSLGAVEQSVDVLLIIECKSVSVISSAMHSQESRLTSRERPLVSGMKYQTKGAAQMKMQPKIK